LLKSYTTKLTVIQITEKQKAMHNLIQKPWIFNPKKCNIAFLKILQYG